MMSLAEVTLVQGRGISGAELVLLIFGAVMTLALIIFFIALIWRNREP